MTKKYPKLSNNQTIRLGGLIAVSCNRRPHEWLLGALERDEFADAEPLRLTEKGINELARLLKLLGVHVGYLNDEPEIQATRDQR
tara:strand:+ start:271 stop:525 length:255 start_codon:yes stop_codon:yes gene_type:complete